MIVGAHRSGSSRYRNPAQIGHHDGVPDPFLFIVGGIAIACIVLFPIRLWRRRRHRYGNENDDLDA